MSSRKRVTIPAILPESDAIQPGKVRTPSAAYVAMADSDLEQSTKKLLVLDLNGTLISRCGQKGKSSFITRPCLTHFLNYVFRYFEVMVWSSAQESTVDNICHIFGDRPLCLKWHRGHFGFTHAEFYSKVEAIKNLERIWEELPQYNATNTIAIDDTPIKLSLQPYNLVKIGTFHPKNDNDSTLLQLIEYLDLVKDTPNVAFHIKNNPFIEDKNRIEDSIEYSNEGKLIGQRKRYLTPPPPLPESPPPSSSSATTSTEVGPKKKKKKKANPKAATKIAKTSDSSSCNPFTSTISSTDSR